ncbi:MAG TPA: alpha/beta hydrolase, partial [Aggregatilineaceae bacterium]|nr:alpha/beta hydrolase [Aggregatilineaceae bacterium]
MSSWQEGDVTVAGVRLHYTRTGGAKPPLVLAHGVTDDGPCWTPVAESLAPDYDIIMVDARGHGFSDAPATGYNLATLAADLNGVITALELQQPIILGHSMGAITALALAGLYPAVPQAILLEDPPAWWFPAQDAPDLVGMRAWFLEMKQQTRDELLNGQRTATPHWSEAELTHCADSKFRVNPRSVQLFEPGISDSIPWPECLPRITCPVLLITADPSLGAIVTPEAAQSLQT